MYLHADVYIYLFIFSYSDLFIFLATEPKPLTSQPRIIAIKKNSQLSNNFGFNFRTITNDNSSKTSYSHIITSIDNNSLNLNLNDYILSINNENIEHLNYEQLKDKLHRIENNQSILLLVAEKNIYQQSLQKSRMNHDLIEQSKASPSNNLHQSQRQYRLKRDPKFKDYGFRIESNQQLDGTTHRIISIERYSPADLPGLSIGDYIIRVNNQSVKHMKSNEINYLMKNEASSNGILVLEVMDENTYRSNSSSKKQSSSASTSFNLKGAHKSGTLSMNKTSYPVMRLCTVRVN
jgi:C-terminal processing protease CtpA/Prc